MKQINMETLNMYNTEDESLKLSAQLVRQVLESSCPQVLGGVEPIQSLLEKKVDEEVQEKLLDPKEKYQQVVENPSSSGFFIDDLLRQTRFVKQEEYFNAVIKQAGIDLKYLDYLNYLNKSMCEEEAIAFGKCFREASKNYEIDRRGSVNSEDMVVYLKQRISTSIKNGLINNIAKFANEAICLWRVYRKLINIYKSSDFISSMRFAH